ncbi:voltage-gated chloride channel protein [bacterium]|nr:voltage-gated chloride channel protein [bacterium]
MTSPAATDRLTHAAGVFACVTRWVLLLLPMAFIVGSSVAFFLWSLDAVTHFRWNHPGIVWFLPLAGIVIALLYRHIGGSSDAGNNLIIDEIHQPGGGVPRRMAPMVLGGTLLTHLFGGSAGREGTAVQMGGAIASGVAKMLRLSDADRRTLLTCGVACGFAAVFGTPLAGTVFALEVISVGRVRYDALLPALAAAVLGDYFCAAWGIHHTHYHVAPPPEGYRLSLDPLIHMAWLIPASICFGGAAWLFSECSHRLAALWKRLIPVYWLRPVAGAAVVLGAMMLLGTRDYLGLGVYTADGTGTSLVNAFDENASIDWFGWLWKLLLTAVTVSSGFKGGEVTPLFFIGATLGHSFARMAGLPVDLFAALGFVAVFAGATNTPLACIIMAVELFGADWLPFFGPACVIAFLVSGKSGIYLSQRVGSMAPSLEGIPLRKLRGE